MIKELKNVLEVLQSVGIEEAVIDPAEDGSVIRAASKEGAIVIFDCIPEKVANFSMGIHSVRALLSRINLFDVEKASASISDDGENVLDMEIKQGRKKAIIRFSDPKRLSAPTTVPDSEKSDDIVFKEEYVQYLSKAIAAMSFTGKKEERTISIHGDGDSLHISISDGEEDSFDEEIEASGIETDKCRWDVVPFQRVMTKSMDYAGQASFVVDEYGIATFDLAVMKVMIAPMAS